MKYCTNCGKLVKENADICLSCGKILKQTINKSSKKEKSKSSYWIFSIILGIASIISFILLFFNLEIFFLSFIFSILAIIFGTMGFLGENRLNIIGFAMGILSMTGLIIIFLIGIYLIFLKQNFIEQGSLTMGLIFKEMKVSIYVVGIIRIFFTREYVRFSESSQKF